MGTWDEIRRGIEYGLPVSHPERLAALAAVEEAEAALAASCAFNSVPLAHTFARITAHYRRLERKRARIAEMHETLRGLRTP
jgi:hypothetical protein